MRFYRGTSNLFSVIRAGFTSAFALAILVSCSDSTAPSTSPNLDVPLAGVTVLTWPISASLKNPPLALSSIVIAGLGGPSGSLGVAPAAALAASLAAPTYTVSTVSFAPEAAPIASPGPSCDDCLWIDNPIGFTFAFFGNSYNKINIGSNGIVGFGINNMRDGCCRGDPIPFDDYNNNIIALGQSDWMPNGVAKAIRYETRGTAPNRRFVLQFTNVSEYGGNGRITAQLVLSEGSNDITLYTTTLSSTVRNRVLTQGIENSAGTEAAFVAGRVQSAFTLTNDAVRFSLAKKNELPTVSAPADLAVNTGAGVCAASVDVGMGTATDDAPGVTVAGARSDGLPLNAAYPKGVTTVTWTATDVKGLTTTADQTVTVNDAEKPGVTAPASISVNNGPGLGSAAVAVGAASATDNCPDVSVAGERGDGAALGVAYPVGITTITWTATDASGNTASAIQNITVSDVDAPSLNVPADFTVDATTRNGAAVSFVTSASDNVGVAGIYCTRVSGSIFPVGSTSVTCTAEDAAGNRTSRTFIVSVRGASAQIAALIAFVEGLRLHNGTANPMLNQLRHALKDADSANPDGACKKMNDFIRMAAGKKGAETGRAVAEGRGQLSGPEVAKMLTDARRILNVLGGEAAAERNPPPSFKVM